MSSHEQLTLWNLPSDVVSAIIGVGLESVGSMRLISPRWNALATAYLSNRKNLPVLPYINVEESHYVPERRMILRLRIPDRLRSYFGVQRWPYRRVVQESEESEKGELNLVKMMAWQDNLGKLFAKCSSIQVLDLQVSHSSLDIVEEAMSDINFDAVSFTPCEPGLPTTYDSQYGDALLEFARKHPVKKLTLYFTDYRAPDWIEDFAVDAVEFIPTVVFEVKREAERWDMLDESERYFNRERWDELSDRMNDYVDIEYREKDVEAKPEQEYVDDEEANGERVEMQEMEDESVLYWFQIRIIATRIIDEDNEMIVDS